MREEVKAILRKIKGDYFDYEDNLISDGYINSFELLYLISALEDYYKVTISADNVNIEQFNSIKLICELIENLR